MMAAYSNEDKCRAYMEQMRGGGNPTCPFCGLHNLCLVFLSLLRVKNINQANAIHCGELGRILGLDRIPEVKTLRNRIAGFTTKENVQQWGAKLNQGWMSANAGLAAVLYIDGHVNIYYGQAHQ